MTDRLAKTPARGTDAYREWNRLRYKANAEAWNAKKSALRAEDVATAKIKERAHRSAAYARLSNDERFVRNNKYYRENRDRVLAERRDKRYGLEAGQYERMRAEQGYSCAICAKPESETPNNNLCVDHCHNSGAVRGLLCRDCNIALGFMERHKDMLSKMIAYAGIAAADQCDAQVAGLQEIIRADRER